MPAGFQRPIRRRKINKQSPLWKRANLSDNFLFHFVVRRRKRTMKKITLLVDFGRHDHIWRQWVHNSVETTIQIWLHAKNKTRNCAFAASMELNVGLQRLCGKSRTSTKQAMRCHFSEWKKKVYGFWFWCFCLYDAAQQQCHDKQISRP